MKNTSEPESSNTVQWNELLKRTKQTLAENLIAAMRVAGCVSDSDVTSPMSQVELSSKTKIARSTIAKLRNLRSDTIQNTCGSPYSPDLATLCRLAWALNIPPAFLLMSQEDWTRLLGAVSGYRETAALATKKGLFERRRAVPIRDRVANFAVKQYQEAIQPEFPNHEADAKDSRRRAFEEDNRSINEKKRTAILATAAIATNGRQSDDKDLIALAIIGSQFGASVK